MCLLVWAWLRRGSSTHPEVFTTEHVEGNRVPVGIGTSVGEDEDHAVLLPHQPDGVFQGEVEGLSCVRGLSQPAQVLHCPGHKDKHTLIKGNDPRAVSGH